MRQPNVRTRRKVVGALTKYAKKLDWARPTQKSKIFSGFAANSFLLGVMLDRNVVAQRAWDAGKWINKSLGRRKNVAAVWENLQSMEPRRLEGFMRYGYRGRAFHRHYKRMASALRGCAGTILNKYKGDPRKIWNVQRNVGKVVDDLQQLSGIGPALSRMAVLILVRDHGLLGGKKALKDLDIKPDIHVMRVFKRAGLIEKNGSKKDAIAAARKFAPRFPGALDPPAWEIGRSWCRPSNPKCDDCPIGSVCPRFVS